MLELIWPFCCKHKVHILSVLFSPPERCIMWLQSTSFCSWFIHFLVQNIHNINSKFRWPGRKSYKGNAILIIYYSWEKNKRIGHVSYEKILFDQDWRYFSGPYMSFAPFPPQIEESRWTAIDLPHDAINGFAAQCTKSFWYGGRIHTKRYALL